MLIRTLVGCIALGALGGVAGACPPAARITGEPALVAELDELLARRGIETSSDPECPAVRVTVTRRDQSIVVGLDTVGEAPIERVVTALNTAATVIESFTRSDMSAPLLATRVVPPAPPPVSRPQGLELETRAPTPVPSRSIQLFSALEHSAGSDRTTWLGAQLGACIPLGPVCAAARFRHARVVGGERWDAKYRRGTIELLLGIDVPFRIGPAIFSPGFAAGLGSMHTRDTMTDLGNDTDGLRADVHTTLIIPLTSKFAIDVFAAVNLVQGIHIDHASTDDLPRTPFGMVRVGLGIRYGGL